jgi:Family of unknown function (DUF6502)
MSMQAKSHIVLACVLRVMKPLARLLVVNGVHYPAFAAALKRVFLDAAQAELTRRGMPHTDSAVSLLCGVHRRDVRNLTRLAPPDDPAQSPSFSLAGEVVARWMSDDALAPEGVPRALPRSGAHPSFDALVAGISRDVRPRAVLDELLRLGVAREDEDGIHLVNDSFTPRQGFEELSWLFSANLHDHLAAGVANLQGEANFLEQSISVDEITEASAEHLQKAAAQAWRAAFKPVMAQTRQRFEGDAAKASAVQRRHRMRFGVYFYSEREQDS